MHNPITIIKIISPSKDPTIKHIRDKNTKFTMKESNEHILMETARKKATCHVIYKTMKE